MNKQSLFGESIYIKCSEKMVEMTSEDQMLGEMRSRIEFDDILGYGIEEDAEVEVSYSLKYIISKIILTAMTTSFTFTKPSSFISPFMLFS